ncbi:hypothetical protein ACI6Q2_15765 [Chitinophagaceae bacterium LWZ2-11]
MKKKLLFLTICGMGLLSVVKVNAQLQRGNVLVGGNLAGFQVGLNTGNQFNVNITPKAAWFIKDNVALGAYVNLGMSGSKYVMPATTYGVGALGRYYISDPKTTFLSGKTRFFVEANAGFQGQNDAEAHASTNGLGFGFGPGIAYFITPTIGLEGLVKYNGIVGFGSDAYQNNLNFNIGFQIYLPGKKAMAALKGK